MKLRTRVVLAGLVLATALVSVPWPSKPLGVCVEPSLIVRKSESVLVLRCAGEERARMWATFGGDPSGPKEREGDEKTPEGIYRIVEVRTSTRFQVFMLLDYPNARDRAQGRTGSAIGIHGQSSAKSLPGRAWIRFAHLISASRWWGPTDGCIALTNEDIVRLAATVRPGTPVTVTP